MAFADVDDDGDMDFAYASKRTYNNLFRNELGDSGELGFTDVSERFGIGDPGHGMGCAVGDYDGDGDQDLYVTNFGSNTLYRNDGGKAFANATSI